MTYSSATKSTPVTVTLVYEEWCALVAGVLLAETLASKAINDMAFYKDASDKLYAQVYGGAAGATGASGATGSSPY